jgi:Raf kinase inhibitor-like YbhB/YbcL family protein
MRRGAPTFIAIAAGALGTLLALAGPPKHPAHPGEEGAMKLTSPAFSHLDPIPRRYTCDTEDVSPPLAWAGLPEGTRSLALVVVDPDAPDPAAPRTIWTHWVLYNLPPDAEGLEEGVAPDSLPAGTREGRNDWRRTGWGGPCPPIGRHRYFFRLYALDRVLPDLKRPSRDVLERSLKPHVLGMAELVGTYERSR